MHANSEPFRTMGVDRTSPHLSCPPKSVCLISELGQRPRFSLGITNNICQERGVEPFEGGRVNRLELR